MTTNDCKALWSPTARLCAVAAGLLVLGLATAGSVFLHRYQFAPSSLEGQVAWRVDDVTGRAVICATELFASRMAADSRGLGIVTRF